MDILIPVLIVDDEYLIRSLVRKSVDWEALGFRITGEAEDGEQALELAEKLHPRLMIVDINIPFLNGLDLSQAIRLRYPDVKIIILTGYEDFGYARRALRTGVLNYILKPINTDEFREALDTARQAILTDERERYLRRESDSGTAKERFLRSLPEGCSGEGPEEIAARFRLFHLGIEPRHIVVCRLDIYPAVEAPFVPAGRGVEIFSDPAGGWVLLANDDARTSRIKDKGYYEFCEELRRDLAARGRELTAGIGLPAAGPGEVPRSHAEACMALAEAFYGGVNRTYLFSSRTAQSTAADGPPAAVDREALLHLFRSGDRRGAEETARRVLRGLCESRPARQYVEMVFLGLVSAAGEFLDENNIPLGNFLDEGGDVFSALREHRTLSAMEDWLLRLFRAIFQRVEANRAGRTTMLVRKAKKYIERNYGRSSLGLDHIAEYCGVTPSYASTVFKKEMGLSVVEYLTEYRLKKAKEIMDRDPLHPIMDVAEDVGYQDAYYFSKCFRRIFGISPSLYLRSKNSGEG